MQILNDEFQHVHQYNPIEHIKARIKTPENCEKAQTLRAGIHHR